MSYLPIRFRFDSAIRELKFLQAATRRNFFENTAETIFPTLIGTLEQLRIDTSGEERNWGVPQESPLRTIETSAYEPGGGGGLKLVGEISWTWGIRPIIPERGRAVEFEVSGNASTKLRLRSTSHDLTNGIGMWRVEHGAADSPGCYFHTQILGEEDNPPFPHSVSIPRLPTLFVTPMSAIEFFLDELFQEQWVQHTIGDQSDRPYWNKMQRSYLLSLFEWKQAQIKNSNGSPWIALKRAKPQGQHGLFNTVRN